MRGTRKKKNISRNDAENCSFSNVYYWCCRIADAREEGERERDGRNGSTAFARDQKLKSRLSGARHKTPGGTMTIKTRLGDSNVHLDIVQYKDVTTALLLSSVPAN